MLRSTASKLMWVGRTAGAVFGLALVLALVLGVATTALAAIPGDPFKLGRINTIDAVSTLVGNVAGPMLKVDNNSTGAGATALDLRVEPGKPPMKVNSAAKVANLNSDKLDGRDSSSFASYKRTVVVSPVGSDTQNGSALINALNGITDASASKPYLLDIEPGTYDLGNGSLQMKQHVDIEGAGELQTVITSTVGGCSTGTVVGANNAELRLLTVRNTSTGNCGLGISNNSASPRLTQVTVESTGGGGVNYAVFNEASSPTMTNVTATASGGTFDNIVVLNINSSNAMMTNVTATASLGVFNENSSATIRNSRLSGSDASLRQSGNSTSKVAGTQLVGRVDRGSTGTLQCFNNYNENLQPVTCP